MAVLPKNSPSLQKFVALLFASPLYHIAPSYLTGDGVIPKFGWSEFSKPRSVLLRLFVLRDAWTSQMPPCSVLLSVFFF